MRESGPSVRAVGTWFGVPWGPGAALARSFQFPRRAPTDEKRAQIERLLRPGEQLVLLTESDIASDGTFGRSWLAVSDQRVMTFGDGEFRVPLVEAALADLKEARCVHRVGRAALETQFDGRKVELVRYTNSYNEKLARIAIARAVLHDPKILILDEATSSVDSETEQPIQEPLARLVKGRTTFAIAHRLSTLRNSDRLMILEEGEVSEFGSHEELMKQEGPYHRLVQIQPELSSVTAVGG